LILNYGGKVLSVNPLYNLDKSLEFVILKNGNFIFLETSSSSLPSPITKNDFSVNI